MQITSLKKKFDSTKEFLPVPFGCHRDERCIYARVGFNLKRNQSFWKVLLTECKVKVKLQILALVDSSKELCHDILTRFSDEQNYFRIEGNLEIIIY